MKKIINFFKSLFTNLEYIPTNVQKSDTSMVVADIKAAEIKEHKKKKKPATKKAAPKKTAKKKTK